MASVGDILDDLELLIERVEESIYERSYDQLVGNSEAYDALTYRLAMVGETCKKLPAELKERHSALPWREMATFRNFASHDYFGIDGNLVWRAAQSLDPIKRMIKEERQRLESSCDKLLP
jgi:uncharacterized protein with HEPN domain